MNKSERNRSFLLAPQSSFKPGRTPSGIVGAPSFPCLEDLGKFKFHASPPSHFMAQIPHRLYLVWSFLGGRHFSADITILEVCPLSQQKFWGAGRRGSEKRSGLVFSSWILWKAPTKGCCKNSATRNIPQSCCWTICSLRNTPWPRFKTNPDSSASQTLTLPVQLGLLWVMGFV